MTFKEGPFQPKTFFDFIISADDKDWDIMLIGVGFKLSPMSRVDKFSTITFLCLSSQQNRTG